MSTATAGMGAYAVIFVGYTVVLLADRGFFKHSRGRRVRVRHSLVVRVWGRLHRSRQAKARVGVKVT